MIDKMLRVCAISDVEPGSQLRVDVDGIGAVAVYNADGEFYATDDACTHLGASLGEEGVLSGHVIQCTWHNGRFDVRTGAVLGPPCTAPLKTYRVVLQQESVYLAMKIEGDTP